mmetsp:Transcript_26371/g.81170  ORF Transcript_26371/g.81170 Transcript_26371/m.81170 type:complete len:104 (+) Transcript_26371:277-588(+)
MHPRWRLIAVVLCGGAAAFRVPPRLGAAAPRAPAPRSSPDDEIGESLETMNSPSEMIKKLKAEMDEAQAAGDTDTVLGLMATLLSLEGAYENEGGDPSQNGAY